MVFNGDHYERRAAPAAEAPRLPPHEQPLGGFIFFCNDETMPLDFERCLFGLPKSFIDSVRGIRKGLPLFLYNYSNRYLHGVFEASSDGGLNLEPNAWATRDARSGVDVSRYPAQVRVRARDIRPPLQEDAFRPVLYHYEPKKFRLELSVSQTAALLKLFSSQIMEPNPARKRNGFAGHSNGSSRADLSRAWRSPLSSFGVDAPAADRVGDDQIRMVEAVSNGDGVQRFSYVAALKSGIQPGSSAHERTENGRTSKVCAAAAATSGAAVLGRLHDPDPAVNSDHQQQFPIYAKPPGKKTSPPTRPWKQKDETRKKPPTIHLHSFTHLPQVPLLAPVQFPVYAPQVTEVDGFYYRPVQRTVEAYAPLQPSAVGWSPSPQPAPVVFLPPPPPLPPPVISMPSPVLVESNFGVLHAEILEFARTARPSPSARARAEAAVECVRRGVKQHWPGADVEVFGSFATGLCLPHSDVDVVVLDAPGILEAAEVSGARAFLPLIRGLAAEFKGHNWCKSLMTIETASMPVIKLCCEPFPDEASDAPPVAIDVTLGGKSSSRSGTKKKPVSVPASAAAAAALVHNGAAAREYVLDKLRQLPALAPLVLLMKSFLHRRGLNSVYTGGLGSFSLTLLLVFYLEQVPLSWSGNAPAVNQQQRPAAPAVPQPAAAAASAASSQSEVSDSEDDETVVTTDSTSTAASEDLAAANGCAHRGHEELISRAWRIVDDLLVCLQAPGAPNLGSLLIGFLHIFGQEFDFSRAKIMLKSCNGSSGVLEPSFQPTSLWIDDPLRPGMNVGAGSFAMSSVQAAMRDMLFVLAKPQQPGDEDHQHERPCSSLPHLDQLFQVS